MKKFPPHWIALLISATFFGFGLFILSDFGPTIDEWIALGCSKTYVRIVQAVFTGGAIPGWPFTDLRGYYFLTDIVRGSITLLTAGFWSHLGFYRGFHLSNLFFSSASLFLLFELVWMITRNLRLAATSALALALMPQFIAHSQNNPHDLIALFALTLGFFCVFMVRETDQAGWLAAGAFGLGWSFTTSPFSALVIPISFLWLLAFDAADLRRRSIRYGILLAGGIFFAFLIWPWALTHNVIARYFSEHHFLLRNLSFWREAYMGEVFHLKDLPWHYIPAHLAASLPGPFLLVLIMNIGWFLSSRYRRYPKGGLLWLAIIWLAIGLFLSFDSVLKYNGMRHFLFLLVPLSILVGTGLERLFLALSKLWPGDINLRIMVVLECLIFGFVFIQAVRFHPYEEAFLNWPAKALAGESAEKYFTLEYFGHAYQEGGEWLNQNAESNAEITVPIFPACANLTLKKKSRKMRLDEFLDTSKPRYLMFITRRSRYNDLINYAEGNLAPVFQIKREKGTLLRVFRNNS